MKKLLQGAPFVAKNTILCRCGGPHPKSTQKEPSKRPLQPKTARRRPQRAPKRDSKTVQNSRKQRKTVENIKNGRIFVEHFHHVHVAVARVARGLKFDSLKQPAFRDRVRRCLLRAAQSAGLIRNIDSAGWEHKTPQALARLLAIVLGKLRKL